MRRRPLLALLTLTVAIGFAAAVMPRVAVACSCVDPATVVDSLGNDPNEAVFTGEVGPPGPDGPPVIVSSWFGGPAPAPVVTLAVTGGDGASCGTDAPPAGRSYLFVSYRTDDGRYGLSLCSPIVDLASPEGAAMLARVTEVLGEPSPVAAAPPADPSLVDTVAGYAPLGIGLLVAVVAVVLGFALIARRDDA